MGGGGGYPAICRRPGTRLARKATLVRAGAILAHGLGLGGARETTLQRSPCLSHSTHLLLKCLCVREGGICARRITYSLYCMHEQPGLQQYYRQMTQCIVSTSAFDAEAWNSRLISIYQDIDLSKCYPLFPLCYAQACTLGIHCTSRIDRN